MFSNTDQTFSLNIRLEFGSLRPFRSRETRVESSISAECCDEEEVKSFVTCDSIMRVGIKEEILSEEKETRSDLNERQVRFGRDPHAGGCDQFEDREMIKFDY